MSPRNDAQDTLRGFIVSLACLEHFAALLNDWYRDYFDISQIHSLWNDPQIVNIYEIHEQYLGKILPVDQIFLNVSSLFIPWVTHLFIALSGYNLARKSPSELAAPLPLLLKNYIFLVCIFFIEGLIVGPNFGQGIALYPITVWFIILSLTSSFYFFTGLKGILIGFLSLLALKAGEQFDYYILPHPDDLLQLIHPWAQQSTNPLNYLLDCLWGILIGSILFKGHKLRVRSKLGILAGGILILIWIYFYHIKDFFIVDPFSITRLDEALTNHTFGTIFILILTGLILGTITEIKSVKTHRIFDLFKWIGINSLGIFLVHRVFFLKVLAPIRLHLGSYLEIPMTNTSAELLFYYLPLTLLFYWLLKRNEFFGKLIQR